MPPILEWSAPVEEGVMDCRRVGFGDEEGPISAVEIPCIAGAKQGPVAFGVPADVEEVFSKAPVAGLVALA